MNLCGTFIIKKKSFKQCIIVSLHTIYLSDFILCRYIERIIFKSLSILSIKRVPSLLGNYKHRHLRLLDQLAETYVA